MHALSRGCVCHNINNRTHDEFYLLLVLLLTKGMISAAQCSAVHCALVAQLVEHRAVTREVVVVVRPDPHVKEPTHLSKRVGHVVPGVVVCVLWCIMVGRVNARRY